MSRQRQLLPLPLALALAACAQPAPMAPQPTTAAPEPPPAAVESPSAPQPTAPAATAPVATALIEGVVRFGQEAMKGMRLSVVDVATGEALPVAATPEDLVRQGKAPLAVHSEGLTTGEEGTFAVQIAGDLSGKVLALVARQDTIVLESTLFADTLQSVARPAPFRLSADEASSGALSGAFQRTGAERVRHLAGVAITPASTVTSTVARGMLRASVEVTGGLAAAAAAAQQMLALTPRVDERLAAANSLNVEIAQAERNGTRSVRAREALTIASVEPEVRRGVAELAVALHGAPTQSATSTPVDLPGTALSLVVRDGALLVRTPSGSEFRGELGISESIEFLANSLRPPSGGSSASAPTVAATIAANAGITTVAGTGTAGTSGDGALASAGQINRPGNMVVDGSGNLYFADEGSNRVRVVAASNGTRFGIAMTAGNIYTVAGTASGFSGDEGLATAARLSAPSAVALDATGNLYIDDRGNYRIRKVDATTGIISTVAGTGTAGSTGDGGPATDATVKNPFGLATFGSKLYIAEYQGHRIRLIQ